ncbi:MAG: chemotaxis protein CheX [Acidimicrobiales bacterium]
MITNDTLREIVSQVWEVQLGLEFNPVDTPERDTTQVYSMRVRINGSWNGEIRACAGRKGAAVIAKAVFGLDLDDLSERDIADGIGELANIVGGNARALLDGRTFIGLPELIERCSGCEPQSQNAIVAVDVGGDVVVFSSRLRPGEQDAPHRSGEDLVTTTESS